MAEKRTSVENPSTLRIEAEVLKFADPKEFKTSKLRLSKLSRSSIDRLATTVVVFGEALCDMQFYPYQKEFSLRIVQSLLLNDGDEITALLSRQSGKTECLAVTFNSLMVMLPALAQYIEDPRLQKFKRGVRVGIFAPVREQAENLYSRMNHHMRTDHARRILLDKDIQQEIDQDGATLALPNGSFAKIHSAAKQARIEGFSYHLIAVDESQDVDPVVARKSISPMGAAVNASQVKIGTANQLRSDFYEACQRNAKRDAHLGKKELPNHFQYDYKVASEYNPYYAAYIKKEIERLGFDSDEFRMAYRLHWLLERGMFVDPTAFDLLGKDYTPVTYDRGNKIVVGIDVGKSDASTVVTVVLPDYDKGNFVGGDDFRCHKRVLNWLALKGDDYVAQFRQITGFLENYTNIFRIMVDATGVGQVVYDMLKTHYAKEIETERLEIIGFIASKQSNHDGYHRMLLDIQTERIEYPNSERARKYQKQRDFVQQMTNLQKIFMGPYLSAEAGDSTPHKDYCSSLMLGLWACDTTEAMGETEEMVNVLIGGRSHERSNRGRAWWKN